MRESQFIPLAEAATALRFTYGRAYNFALSGQLDRVRREGSRLFVERSAVEKQAASADDKVGSSR